MKTILRTKQNIDYFIYDYFSQDSDRRPETALDILNKMRYNTEKQRFYKVTENGNKGQKNCLRKWTGDLQKNGCR